ncbi:MAG: hypothetical protein ACLR0U_28010 [Enterocloster clostridioformis]
MMKKQMRNAFWQQRLRNDGLILSACGNRGRLTHGERVHSS